MPTKAERFASWKGPKADVTNLSTVERFSVYIDSIVAKKEEGLSTLKSDFADKNSAKYKDIGRHTIGSLAYCKVCVDEALETSTTQKEKEILTGLSNVLSELYDNPSSETKGKIDNLVKGTEAYLALKPEDHADKEHARSLSCAFYATFKAIEIRLANLSWVENKLASGVVGNIEPLLQKLVRLINRTETKIKVLANASNVALTTDSDIALPKTIQEQINDKCLALFSNPVPEIDKINALKTTMDEVSTGLDGLIKAKDKKTALESNIHQITALLKAAEDNDSKSTGRKYFAELVEDNKDTYKVLMDQGAPDKKADLVRDIDRLEKQKGTYVATALGIGSYFSTAMRVVTSPWLPKSDLLASVAPATADSTCKTGLKQLARETLTALNDQLKEVDQVISTTAEKIAGGNNSFKERLVSESSTNLIPIRDNNLAIKGAVDKYNEIAAPIIVKQAKLEKIKGNNPVLDEFIKEHDNWKVRAYNYFTGLRSLFSNTTKEKADVVNEAKALKTQLSDFEKQYEKEVKEELKGITDDPTVDPSIKEKVVETVKSEVKSKSVTENPSPKAELTTPGVKAQFMAFRSKLNDIVGEKPNVIAQEKENVKNTDAAFATAPTTERASIPMTTKFESTSESIIQSEPEPLAAMKSPASTTLKNDLHLLVENKREETTAKETETGKDLEENTASTTAIKH